jgi:hypothetical protein
VTIPTAVREEIRSWLWTEADRLFWSSLSFTDKSRYYTIWTENPAIGGKLAGYMDPRQVRVYIKDTLLKSYTRERLSDPAPVLRLLNLPSDSKFIETYIKPHGRRLSDKREIAWSRATEWKATLMALHERAFEGKGQPFGAVLFEARTKHADPPAREVVEQAREKLGIQKIVWID